METVEPKRRVAVVRYDGTPDALKKAVELCGGFDELKTDHRILLKPNILWGGTRKLPPFGVVTTSAMVGDLLGLLRERACRDIAVGRALHLGQHSPIPCPPLACQSSPFFLQAFESRK